MAALNGWLTQPIQASVGSVATVATERFSHNQEAAAVSGGMRRLTWILPCADADGRKSVVWRFTPAATKGTLDPPWCSRKPNDGQSRS